MSRVSAGTLFRERAPDESRTEDRQSGPVRAEYDAAQVEPAHGARVHLRKERILLELSGLLRQLSLGALQLRDVGSEHECLTSPGLVHQREREREVADLLLVPERPALRQQRAPTFLDLVAPQLEPGAADEVLATEDSAGGRVHVGDRAVLEQSKDWARVGVGVQADGPALVRFRS